MFVIHLPTVFRFPLYMDVCHSNWNHVYFVCVGVQRVRQLQRPVRVPQDFVRTGVPRASVIVANHFKLRTTDETHWTSSGFRSRYLLQEQVQSGLLHPVPSGSVSSSYLVSFVIFKRGRGHLLRHKNMTYVTH